MICLTTSVLTLLFIWYLVFGSLQFSCAIIEFLLNIGRFNVRENASIDWKIKESVKAKLKVIVKRKLRQFGYPPDMEILATEIVLKQAELIAAELNL